MKIYRQQRISTKLVGSSTKLNYQFGRKMSNSKTVSHLALISYSVFEVYCISIIDATRETSRQMFCVPN
jgi:hypothetical protein